MRHKEPLNQPEQVPKPEPVENKLVTFAKEIYGIWISERPSQFAAALAFFQLQHTLNTIWQVPPPRRGQTRAYVLNRLLALAMVLGVALLLIVVAVANLLVSLVNAQVQWGGFVSTANFFAMTGLAALTFALIYKVLPNANIAWRHVWVGGGGGRASVDLRSLFGQTLLERQPV